MGGCGSGRWRAHIKTYTVEDCLPLNVDKLVRDRLLRGGCHAYGNLVWSVKSSGKQISTCGFEFNTVNTPAAWLRLMYTVSGTKEQIDYRLTLTTTKPVRGGFRWWFACPLSIDGKPCSRRAGGYIYRQGQNISVAGNATASPIRAARRAINLIAFSLN